MELDKIAIISDVHANMPALEAVLADIRGRGIDLIYNLGDLVGKGPQSDEAVDACRAVCHVTVRGNWDDVLASDRELSWPSSAWYQAQLGAERLTYLRDLPNAYDFMLSGKRVRLVHASQESVYTRVYPTHPRETLLAMFDNTPFTGEDTPAPDIVGYGDIHSTYMRTFDDGHKLLFNAGSVGNPLDMPLASYAILSGRVDSAASGPLGIEFVRLPYNIDRTLDIARQINAPDYEVYAVELRDAIYRGRQA